METVNGYLEQTSDVGKQEQIENNLWRQKEKVKSNDSFEQP